MTPQEHQRPVHAQTAAAGAEPGLQLPKVVWQEARWRPGGFWGHMS